MNLNLQCLRAHAAGSAGTTPSSGNVSPTFLRRPTVTVHAEVDRAGALERSDGSQSDGDDAPEAGARILPLSRR